MPHNLSFYLAMPEEQAVTGLLDALDWDEAIATKVAHKAAETISSMRKTKRKAGSIEGFFQTYGLNSEEGVALMCLAEALLRIPDPATADALIRDKIAGTEWVKDLVGKDDWMMKMAGLGLSASRSTLEGPLARLGGPVIRNALMQGMKVLGGQFVVGQSIKDALKHGAQMEKEKGYSFSFDMLGEGARTDEDAQIYLQHYADAIDEIGQDYVRRKGQKPGISVKLSALHPRYAFSQEADCVPSLIRKLQALCKKAAEYDICLTVDAEEVDRLETSLKIIRPIMEDAGLGQWEGFGLAVQAYGKRCLPLVENLIEMARDTRRKIQIRLVKGAYWDTEIKRAQIDGLIDYPVFTRKNHTDLSYLVCAQKLLQARRHVYPMFGTHNAYTVEAIVAMAGEDRSGFEFQRLYGMGEALFDHVRMIGNLPVRIYAPVGVHKDLLPYLVRRLLENGANSSFVNKVFDPAIPPADLCVDPVFYAHHTKGGAHPSIPLPRDIFGGERANSKGIDLKDAATLQQTLSAMEAAYEGRELFCGSVVNGRMEKLGSSYGITNPADTSEIIGTAYAANGEIINRAFAAAKKGQAGWNAQSASERAAILNRIADLYEEHTPLLLSLCNKEAGKTLSDAVAEVREAVDFCRYYAALGEKYFDRNGRILRSYTGESNKILLQGRGVFVCISPWNFPLAIFTGQVVAALMSGNSVVSKPAEQTPFVAQAAIALMHKAGVPADVLHLIIGDGRIGEMLVQHEDVAGVAFTGSTGAAWSINRSLAAKDNAIVPLIAETGGQNALIADSSSLPEQVVDDVILSAFGSAGQRCSAARVLFVQEDVADKVVSMLRGAMEELKVGNPQYYATDIGPVIDEEALASLQKHKTALEGFGRFVAEVPMPEILRQRGHYFAPIAYEIDEISQLKQEVFGPILHIIRFKASEFDQIIQSINDTGYGLTFGIHTRIDAVAEKTAMLSKAGNVYVNRSIIGAVVGVQPFGGNGLSGTGPKAGGPHYLHRFAAEKVISVNTTAAGGNASLVMLEE